MLKYYRRNVLKSGMCFNLKGEGSERDTDKQCCHEVLTIKLGDGDTKVPYLCTALYLCE